MAQLPAQPEVTQCPDPESEAIGTAAHPVINFYASCFGVLRKSLRNSDEWIDEWGREMAILWGLFRENLSFITAHSRKMVR